jgi:hypothetical protein
MQHRAIKKVYGSVADNPFLNPDNPLKASLLSEVFAAMGN